MIHLHIGITITIWYSVVGRLNIAYSGHAHNVKQNTDTTPYVGKQPQAPSVVHDQHQITLHSKVNNRELAGRRHSLGWIQSNEYLE